MYLDSGESYRLSRLARDVETDSFMHEAGDLQVQQRKDASRARRLHNSFMLCERSEAGRIPLQAKSAIERQPNIPLIRAKLWLVTARDTARLVRLLSSS